MAALGAEGRRFESCLPDHKSSTYVDGDRERIGNDRHDAARVGAESHGIVPDCGYTFADERDWLAPPKGFGLYYYCPDRFAAFLRWQGYGEGGRVGVCPTPPKWAVEDCPKLWRRREECGQAWSTYFALGRYSGRIKIGQSRNPRQRMKTLAYSTSGEPADLLVTVRGRHMEGAYHKAFSNWHDSNEWFAPHPDIWAEIERLRSRDA